MSNTPLKKPWSKKEPIELAGADKRDGLRVLVPRGIPEWRVPEPVDLASFGVNDAPDPLSFDLQVTTYRRTERLAGALRIRVYEKETTS